MTKVRRIAWGAAWANAPWDGRARPPEPLRMPNTDAAPLPPAAAPRSLRRTAFGTVLANAPWAGRPVAVTPPAAEPTPEPLFAEVPA